MIDDPIAAAARGRTFLFVPGDRPDRFDKAAASGADLMIIDLEDAVAPAARVGARSAVDAYLTGGGVAAVRINAADTPDHPADRDLVRRHGCPVMLARTTTPESIIALAPCTVIALIETAAGVLAAPSLAATPLVTRLALGHLDLSAELGVDPDHRDALHSTRSALVLASAAAHLAPPVDGVTVDIGSEEALRADVEHASRLGFGGKLCIHPRQLSLASAVLSPDETTIAWARRVLDAASGSAVAVLDGQFVDRPVVERARRVLAATNLPTDPVTPPERKRR
ncbi:HpcH/HpaI aldolase/citrate lyase family protein [Aeromicrobium sp. CF3.5]|uniref:HpcH/HpaI aldolase/citrate lyase family protein n=1 Tax=Aeromicrobium sp. CF3.5 TaxID=3373078 RepID=UPI003EE66C25